MREEVGGGGELAHGRNRGSVEPAASRNRGRDPGRLSEPVGDQEGAGDDERRKPCRLEADGEARDDVRRRARLRGFRDLPYGSISRLRVVLSDPNVQKPGHRARKPAEQNRKPGPRSRPLRGRRREHAPRRDREQDRRDDRRHEVSAVERRHGGLLLSGSTDVHADNRGEDSESSSEEREDDPRDSEVSEQRHTEDHRPDVFRRSRFEQVRAAARTIADVVAHEVRDHRRISRIVLRDPAFDLPNQVRPDVGRLRVDPAAELGEEGDEARSEPERHDRQDEQGLVPLRRGDPVAVSVIQDRDAREGHRDDREARDRASPKRGDEGVVERLQGTRGRSDVRSNRDVHADEPRQGRETRTEAEGKGRLQPRLPSSLQTEGDCEDDRQPPGNWGNCFVLPTEECSRTQLNRTGNLPHPVVAGVAPQDVPGEHGSAAQAGDDRDRNHITKVELRHAMHPRGGTCGASSSCYIGFDGCGLDPVRESGERRQAPYFSARFDAFRRRFMTSWPQIRPSAPCAMLRSSKFSTSSTRTRSVMGTRSGYTPAPRRTTVFAGGSPFATRARLTGWSFRTLYACFVNAFTAFAVAFASGFRASDSRIASPAWWGSVSVTSGERPRPRRTTATRWSVPARTIVLILPSFRPSSAFARSSVPSRIRPARRSVSRRSSSAEAKFPRNAMSPGSSSIPTPAASKGPRPV